MALLVAPTFTEPKLPIEDCAIALDAKLSVAAIPIPHTKRMSAPHTAAIQSGSNR